MNRKNLIPFVYLFSTLLPLFITVSCTGTNSSKEIKKIYKLDELDEAPEFPGGYGKFIEYLVQGIKSAPNGTFDGIKEKIHIGFIINKDGKVSEVKVITPIALGAERAL
jgi:protein TonB